MCSQHVCGPPITPTTLVILSESIFQYEPFQESMEIYFGLERHIYASEGGKRSLNIRGENDCRRLHCSLRDLSSLLQGMGRLADHFIGKNYTERFSDGQVLLERLETCYFLCGCFWIR